MTQAGKTVGLTLIGLLMIGGAARGITPDSPANANPYQGIVDRNVFGLRPPPPPQEAPPPPKPPVNITLTGITTLMEKKRAFMSVTGSPKPGAPAATTSYMLTEGERQGDIEIVQIDEKEGSVKLKQSDTPVTISFKENGVKGGPPPTAVAGQPNPGFQPFTPAAFPGQKTIPNTIPGRPLRIPGTGTTGSGTQPGGGAAAFPEPTYYNGAAPPQAQQPQNQLQLDHETGALLMEAERLRLQDSGNPLANAIPNTRLTPTPPTDVGTDGRQQNPGNPLSLPFPPSRPRR